MTSKSLRSIIKQATGQDVAFCLGCPGCDARPRKGRDLPIGHLIQLILMDEEAALQSHMLWSDSTLQAARGACKRGLNLHAVLLALRAESMQRNKLQQEKE